MTQGSATFQSLGTTDLKHSLRHEEIEKYPYF